MQALSPPALSPAHRPTVQRYVGLPVTRVSQASCAPRALPHATPEGADAPSAKYMRLLHFVEENSTARPAGNAVAASTADSAAAPMQQPTWHLSYCEESEEGGELSEPELLAHTRFAAAAQPRTSQAAPQPAAAAAVPVAHAASAAPAAGSTSIYATEFYARRLAASAAARREQPSASTSGRSAMAPAAELASARGPRRRSLDQKRGEPVKPCVGDLECMAAWVDPDILSAAAEAQQAAAKGSAAARERYATIMAFLERNGTHALAGTAAVLSRFREADLAMEPRALQNWQLTWDEDAHGTDSVLGSC